MRALAVRLPAQRLCEVNVPALAAVAYGRAFSDQALKKDVETVAAAKPSVPSGKLGLTDHRVSKLEKFFLVWGGKYKTIAEVPDHVNQDVLERARNKARIKINIWMCVATLFGCLGMIYSGKKARERGESVSKMNEDWHKKHNEAEGAKTE